MEYIKKLFQETDYLEQMKYLEKLEAERRFCRHGLGHCLDVARIAWILVMEDSKGKQWEKEQIYLGALLHDLGRIAEYETQIPHHQAGRETAEAFLRKIGYPVEKQKDILRAIEGHRGEEKTNDDFINLLKKADNQSRNCFYCSESETCNWSEERKNREIQW